MVLRFGIQLRNFPTQSAGPDVFTKIGEIARQAEALHYDSVWMIDHLMLRPPIAPQSQPIPDCWLVLAELARSTSRIAVGPLVSSVLFRDTSFLVSACSTLSDLSGGRLIAGLGSGWYEEEFRSFGIDFPRPKERARILENAVKEIKNASSSQSIPVWIGGSGEKVTLPLVVKIADGCSLQGSLSAVEQKVALLRSLCEAGGRKFDTITVSKQSNVIISDDENGVKRKLRGIISDKAKWPSFRENNIVGTPIECAQQISRLASAGVTYFTLNFPDVLSGLDSVRLFDKEVIAKLRSASIYA